MKMYGKWAGNPLGKPENQEDCIKEVWPSNGYIPHQCYRKRGYGPDKLYCKHHAKMEEQDVEDD